MSMQPHGTKRGIVLRHWTTGDSWLGEPQQKPSPALEYWDLAGRRRRDLVASMLKLVKTPAVGQIG
jgi:hypothetical protein